jgi:heme/copper-type cytochrome/quinol oxidase subunit 1
MKSELISWIALALVSTFIIGLATGFRFDTLDIQLHDTYYVFGSFDCIKMLTVILIIGRGLYRLTDILADRYLILALILVIVNAIAGLFVIIGTYLGVEAIITMRTTNPHVDLSAYILISGILVGIFTTQAIVEVRMVKKLRGLLAGR